jgi:hypothetical protein
MLALELVQAPAGADQDPRQARLGVQLMPGQRRPVGRQRPQLFKLVGFVDLQHPLWKVGSRFEGQLPAVGRAQQPSDHQRVHGRLQHAAWCGRLDPDPPRPRSQVRTTGQPSLLPGIPVEPVQPPQ